MKLIEDLGTSKTKKGRRVRYGIYLCECGRKTKVNQYDVNRKRGNKVCYKCSQSANGSKHNLSGTRLYRIWTNIKQRLYNPKNKDYPRYGGRGIEMEMSWKKYFKVFHEWALTHGYEDGFELHRKDNNEGYLPFNCVWLSKEEHLKVHKEMTALAKKDIVQSELLEVLK